MVTESRLSDYFLSPSPSLSFSIYYKIIFESRPNERNLLRLLWYHSLLIEPPCYMDVGSSLNLIFMQLHFPISSRTRHRPRILKFSREIKETEICITFVLLYTFWHNLKSSMNAQKSKYYVK